MVGFSGANLAHAHSGGTDSNGCHAGSQPYHCHTLKPSGGFMAPSTNWYSPPAVKPYKSPSTSWNTPSPFKPYKAPSTNWYSAPSLKPYQSPMLGNSFGPTALCRDGTLSYSQTRQGTCSWHGGVWKWFR